MGMIAKKALESQSRIKIIGSQKSIAIGRETAPSKQLYSTLAGKHSWFGSVSLKNKNDYQ